ncbi:MAG: tRNA (guanosine(46)-N7)-methyltransferase TrmB [Sphingosinicella sp.]|nr:tRNA (guanosine(46)-N7)-methyltransferase TrmB [Sphingosinicella sp.]
MSDPTTIRRLYGRRQAFALRNRAQRLVEELLPAVAVPKDEPLDAARLFGKACLLELEIGFGKGEHLVAHAAARPETGFIGCEPFLNGVTGLLGHIEDEGLTNVRVHDGDALNVLERLPDASLERVYLLHPDPWPKARHAKRRFVNPGPLDRIAAKLKLGGEFRLATDHPVYMRWAVMQMARRGDFEWLAEHPSDWETRPDDWPPTRYGEWAAGEGRPIWYFRYRRR